MFSPLKRKSGTLAVVAYEDRDPVLCSRLSLGESPVVALSGTRFAVLPQISCVPPSPATDIPSASRTYTKTKVVATPIKPSQDSIPLRFEEDAVQPSCGRGVRADSLRNSSLVLGGLFSKREPDTFSYSMVVREHADEALEETPPFVAAEEIKLCVAPAAATTTAATTTTTTSQGQYRMLSGTELEKYAKMRKMGLPQGAIENAMLKDLVHPKSLFGEDAINKDPKSVQIVIAAVDETKRLGSGSGSGTDRTRSLMEELARKQQEKKADTSGLTVEERIRLNKTQRIKGTTPINLIAMLRPTGSGAASNHPSGANPKLVLHPTTRIKPKQKAAAVSPSAAAAAKRSPFDSLKDLLVVLKLDEPVLQVYHRLAGEGFDTPDKLVLFLEPGDDAATRANLSEVVSLPEDAARIARALPVLEEMQRCKEALDSACSQDAIDLALCEYQRIAKLLS